MFIVSYKVKIILRNFYWTFNLSLKMKITTKHNPEARNDPDIIYPSPAN